MFCEQCGADLEQDAHFCGMCGAKVGNGATNVSGQPLSRGISDRRVRRLQIGLIAAMVLVVAFGGALFWIAGPEKVDVLNVGSDPKVLTRANAAKLIEQSKEMKFYTEFLELDRTAVRDGEARGLWKFRPYLHMDRGINAYLEFTPMGLNEVIAKITEEKTATGSKAIQLYNDEKTGKLWAMDLHIEAPMTVTVTGITDAPEFMKGKVVEFTSRFLTPNLLNKYIRSREVTGSGEAHLVLYDNGWRVESVEVKWTNANPQ